MKVFMLSFSSENNQVDRAMVQNFLDTRSNVLNWYGIMPNTILITLDENGHPSDLSIPLRNEFGDAIQFIVTEIDTYKTDGFINSEVWDFINQPKRSNFHLK